MEAKLRKIRVYDPNDGDFIIDIPDDSKVTFGYFNPTTPSRTGRQYDNYGPDNVARQTALRIYEGKTEKSNQIACFIGVTGFRDESVTLTKMVEKITVTRAYTNNGNGHETDNLERKALVEAVPEGRYQ